MVEPVDRVGEDPQDGRGEHGARRASRRPYSRGGQCSILATERTQQMSMLDIDPTANRVDDTRTGGCLGGQADHLAGNRVIGERTATISPPHRHLPCRDPRIYRN
ncbi:MAG: hypothetical protein ACRDP2_17990 [Nocardioidaceae bacterium]